MFDDRIIIKRDGTQQYFCPNCGHGKHDRFIIFDEPAAIGGYHVILDPDSYPPTYKLKSTTVNSGGTYTTISVRHVIRFCLKTKKLVGECIAEHGYYRLPGYDTFFRKDNIRIQAAYNELIQEEIMQVGSMWLLTASRSALNADIINTISHCIIDLMIERLV